MNDFASHCVIDDFNRDVCQRLKQSSRPGIGATKPEVVLIELVHVVHVFYDHIFIP